MKTMSQKDFDRLGKKRGVKVKRKMGAQPKKPEPDVKVDDAVALSGVETPETKTPAPALQPAASMSASTAARDAQLEMVISNNTKVIQKFQAQLVAQLSAVKKRVAWRHKVLRKDQLIDEVISTPIES